MSRRRILLLMFTFQIMHLLTPPSSGHAATLHWDASSGVVEGYIIYWGTDSEMPEHSLDVKGRTAFHLSRLPLSEGVTYFFSVSAYNSVGESARCDPVEFKPQDITPPLPPVGLTANRREIRIGGFEPPRYRQSCPSSDLPSGRFGPAIGFRGPRWPAGAAFGAGWPSA
jgi:hypothetical protein